MSEWIDSSNERHCRNYDNGDMWHVEAHDRRSATILEGVGAKRIQTPHDGVSFDCTPQQLIEYVAALHGLNVEFRKRKRQQLSPEEKQRRRERMLALRAAQNA